MIINYNLNKNRYSETAIMYVWLIVFIRRHLLKKKNKMIKLRLWKMIKLRFWKGLRSFGKSTKSFEKLIVGAG